MDKPKIRTPKMFLEHPWVILVDGRFHCEANELWTVEPVINGKNYSPFEVSICLCGHSLTEYNRGAPYRSDYDSLPFCKNCEKRLNKLGLTRKDCER